MLLSFGRIKTISPPHTNRKNNPEVEPLPYTQMELGQIRDQLNREMVMIRKLASYADQMKDPSLKQMCNDLKGAHQQHYSLLLRHLAQERIPLQ